MRNGIHAHEVLRMMEGNSYSREDLKVAIIEKFGIEQLFYTCSAENMTTDEIINFLENKDKFMPSGEGFTVNLEKVCSDY